MSHKRLKDLSSLDLPLTCLLNSSLNSNHSTKSHSKSKDPRMTHPKIKPYLKYSMDVPDNVLRILAPRYRAKQMRRLDAPNLLAYLTYSGRNSIYLKKFLRHAKHLKRLCISYDENWLSLDTFLPNVFNLLKYLPNLKVLKLNWEKNNHIQRTDLFELLGKRVLLLKGLKHFDLRASFHNLKIHETKQLFTFLRALRSKLEVLKLHCNRCFNFDNSYLELMKKYIVWLNNTKNLSLGFAYNHKITNEGLNHLALALRKLKNISKLGLTLSNFNNISDKGIGHLLRAIRLKTSLKVLFLNFSEHSKLSNIAIGKIKRALRDLKNLRSLQIDLSSRHIGKGITVKGTQLLSHGFTNLNNLQKLHLAFNQCLKLSDRAVPILLNPVKSPAFNTVQFSFANCPQVGPEIFNLLKETFQGRQVPLRIGLHLKGCGGVNTQSLNQLNGFLQNVKAVNLFVDLEECSAIDDKALEVLAQSGRLDQRKVKIKITEKQVSKAKQRSLQNKLKSVTLLIDEEKITNF